MGQVHLCEQSGTLCCLHRWFQTDGGFRRAADAFGQARVEGAWMKSRYFPVETTGAKKLEQTFLTRLKESKEAVQALF